ncbi:MAG: hypothetical protein IAE91_10800 [Ignavibacteriaceae bacterium]|nr:hypothetical protein [Ignavibacteriaceae bacterium]
MRKFVLFFIVFSALVFSQSEKNSPTISFFGFLKTDVFMDTREGVSIREGHFLLYPQNENLDAQGNDINDKASFNILSIQSRLGAKITGPDVLGAKATGLLEGEFFGHIESDINGFRLRHALIKLDWANTSILIGQYWHPMYVPEVAPAVVSYNNGVPFQPFSRNPQIRLVQSFDNLKFILVAASQRDFASPGPQGFSSIYMRDAVIPNLHFQIQYAGSSFFAGAGVDYKKLVARIMTADNHRYEAAVNSISFIGYAKLIVDPVTFKVEGVYGSNMADQLMLGGYAVKSRNFVTYEIEYTPLNTFSVWGEFSTGKDVEFGVFGGYAMNLGADDNILSTSFNRGGNIESVFRVSPRLQLNFSPVRFSGEVEYTTANYGTVNNNNKGKVENAKSFSNIRVVLAAYYFF